MDKCKSFKHSAEMREYWRLEKRKQRARPRGVKDVKTDRTRIWRQASLKFEDFKDKVREHSQNEQPLSASFMLFRKAKKHNE